MNTAGNQIWLRLLVLAAVGGLLLCGPARCADDDLGQQLKALNSVTGTDDINAKVRDLIKDKAGTEKLLKKAEDLLKSDPKSFKQNAASILARASAGLKNYDLSLKFFGLCKDLSLKVKSWNKLAEAYEGRIAVLSAQKKYGEAEKACLEFLETEGDEKLEEMKFFVKEMLVKLMARQGKIQDALKMVDSMAKDFGESWYVTQLKGEVLHEAGKSADAAAAYQDAIEKLETSERPKPEAKEPFLDRLHYALSNVYVELDQVDKAAEHLKALLKKHPDNPTYNNDLGYIWADHNQNLDESEKLIRKALEEDKKQRQKIKDLPKEEDVDKAAYLDSMAWVLFKKKNYAEAKKYMLEAVKDKDEGQHIEILDHLADIHMALGEKAEAIAVWKKALEGEANTKRELKRRDEVEKKLKEAEKK